MLHKSQERNMKTLYTIGEAAEKVGVTSETLRHYDRINLVKPSVTDKQTSYRYYTNNHNTKQYYFFHNPSPSPFYIIIIPCILSQKKKKHISLIFVKSSN